MPSEYELDGLPHHIRGFALMHMAMRRDARRLLAAAPALRPSQYAGVEAWWRQVRDVIDWHHRTEDDIVWPELNQRVPGFAANEVALHVDHSALEQAMEAISVILAPGGDIARLPSAANQFEALIDEHLRHEEMVVFPIFINAMTVSEYTAVERRVIESAPFKIMGFLQPWMFDSVDRRAVSSVAATIPPPVRVLGNTMLRWRYERIIAPVLSAADYRRKKAR